MTKKHDRNSASKASDSTQASTDKSTNKPAEPEVTPKVEFGLELGGFLGGLFKGLGKIIDLAEQAEQAGGELREAGEIRGGTKERPIRGIYGFTIRTGLGKERPRVETFGNIKATRERKQAKPEFTVTETREPIVDVFDEQDYIVVVAELPGAIEESIKLDLHGDILIVEAGNEKIKYSKEILLPAKIDFEKKEMSFKNGVLEIKMKKR
ncbi:MAG: gas vesicle protein GvpH [Patescibacteria group bacterium]